jgi:hypothetical protein
VDQDGDASRGLERQGSIRDRAHKRGVICSRICPALYPDAAAEKNGLERSRTWVSVPLYLQNIDFLALLRSSRLVGR